MRLKALTSPGWTDVVLADLDAFLIDHAACERKAFSSAMMLVSQYRDKRELVAAMIDLAREELEHFHQVFQLLDERGLFLGPHKKDRYVEPLSAWVRPEHPHKFLDRLLVAGVIEARSCERLGLFTDALPPGGMKDFYLQLTQCEARHHALFVRLAKTYFPAADVEERLDELLEREARIVAELPHQALVH